MRVVRRFSILILIYVFSLTALLSAQSVGSGTVEGTVADSTGAVVAGATVEIANPITGFRQTATTDATGTFRFTNVPVMRS